MIAAMLEEENCTEQLELQKQLSKEMKEGVEIVSMCEQDEQL